MLCRIFKHMFLWNSFKRHINIQKGNAGTLIFEFSVKFRFEWYQFHRLKPKPCQVGAKTVFREARQPRRPLRDVSSCRRFVLPPLGPSAVPSSSFFWTTHLVLGTRRRRRFKPPPRCFRHSSVVVVEIHVPALDNVPAMMWCQIMHLAASLCEFNGCRYSLARCPQRI